MAPNDGSGVGSQLKSDRNVVGQSLIANEACNGDGAAAAASAEVVQASPREVTVNLITGGLGLGMFSLPWSTAGASFTIGIGIIAVTILLNGWTVRILIEGAERHQAFDLGKLLSYLPRPISTAAQLCTNAAVWTVLFLGQVGYTNVMATALQSISEGTFLHSRPVAVVAVSVLVFPLCFFNQRYLSFSSTIAVLVNVYIFAVMAVGPKQPTGTCVVGFGTGAAAMVSVMMQAVVVQMCVLPMYQELRPSDRSPAKFSKVVAHGFGALFFIYSAFAAVGYLRFGPEVQGNILDSLPANVWGKAGKVGAAFAVGGVYPIFEQAMLAPVWNAQTRYRKPLYLFATSLNVSVIALTAMKFDDISAINVYSGAICSIAFVAAVPSIVGIFLLGRTSRRWRLAMLILFVVGLTAGVLGLVLTDNYRQQLDEHCPWKL